MAECINCGSYTNGKEITPNCKNYLGNRKEFDTDKDIIKNYCKYAIEFFETVD